MEELSSNLKIIEPDSALFIGFDISLEFELAIARFEMRRKVIEIVNEKTELIACRVMVSYSSKVKILLNKSIT